MPQDIVELIEPYRASDSGRWAKLASNVQWRRLVLLLLREIVVELRAAYGESRVLCFDRHTSRNASWQSVEGISEDLIDMLLLARTTRFYASYLSTFSEAAWWLGGAKADVSVF